MSFVKKKKENICGLVFQKKKNPVMFICPMKTVFIRKVVSQIIKETRNARIIPADLFVCTWYIQRNCWSLQKWATSSISWFIAFAFRCSSLRDLTCPYFRPLSSARDSGKGLLGNTKAWTVNHCYVVVVASLSMKVTPMNDEWSHVIVVLSTCGLHCATHLSIYLLLFSKKKEIFIWF